MLYRMLGDVNHRLGGAVCLAVGVGVGLRVIAPATQYHIIIIVVVCSRYQTYYFVDSHRLLYNLGIIPTILCFPYWTLRPDVFVYVILLYSIVINDTGRVTVVAMVLLYLLLKTELVGKWLDVYKFGNNNVLFRSHFQCHSEHLYVCFNILN